VEGSEGLRGNKVCRITAAGLKHPPTRSICASAAEGFEIFYTLREAPDRHRELATPLQHDLGALSQHSRRHIRGDRRNLGQD